MTLFLQLMYIALAAGAISFTFTFTSIFMSIRETLSRIHHKIEELVHCPWCFGHYVVLVILLIDGVSWIPVTHFAFINFLLTWFAVVCMMAPLHYILLRAYEPVSKAMVNRQLMKLRDTQEE
jgi:uncharacterized protein YacL